MIFYETTQSIRAQAELDQLCTELLESAPLIDEDPFDFMTRTYYESQFVEKQIEMSTMLEEYAYLKETGCELVTESNKFTDTVKKIFTAIKDAIVKAAKAVAAFFKKIFTRNKERDKKAEEEINKEEKAILLLTMKQSASDTSSDSNADTSTKDEPSKEEPKENPSSNTDSSEKKSDVKKASDLKDKRSNRKDIISKIIVDMSDFKYRGGYTNLTPSLCEPLHVGMNYTIALSDMLERVAYSSLTRNGTKDTDFTSAEGDEYISKAKDLVSKVENYMQKLDDFDTYMDDVIPEKSGESGINNKKLTEILKTTKAILKDQSISYDSMFTSQEDNFKRFEKRIDKLSTKLMQNATGAGAGAMVSCAKMANAGYNKIISYMMLNAKHSVRIADMNYNETYRYAKACTAKYRAALGRA